MKDKDRIPKLKTVGSDEIALKAPSGKIRVIGVWAEDGDVFDWIGDYDDLAVAKLNIDRCRDSGPWTGIFYKAVDDQGKQIYPEEAQPPTHRVSYG